MYFEQSLDDVGTKIIELRTAAPISAIRLDFKGTNGSTDNIDNRLNDVITKIELVDGSDSLLSLSLKEAQALEFRRTGHMPFMRPGESNSGGQEEQVLLLFGRHLWDPEIYMDLSKFRNPQLKITTNIAAIRAHGVDGFLSNSLKVTIDLLVIEEGAAEAVGFMMAKKIYGFTSGTSGDERVELPSDYPFVNLMVRAYAAGNDVDENISALKIDCDVGKFIPIDKKVKDIYKSEEQDRGPAELHYHIFRKNADTVTHDLNHDPIVALTPNKTNRIASVGYSWSSRFDLFLTDSAGAAIAARELVLLGVRGSCPHATINVPFGLRADPLTYFDPKKFVDIDLVLTQAAASAVSVVLEQLRSYVKA